MQISSYVRHIYLLVASHANEPKYCATKDFEHSTFLNALQSDSWDELQLHQPLSSTLTLKKQQAV